MKPTLTSSWHRKRFVACGARVLCQGIEFSWTSASSNATASSQPAWSWDDTSILQVENDLPCWYVLDALNKDGEIYQTCILKRYWMTVDKISTDYVAIWHRPDPSFLVSWGVWLAEQRMGTPVSEEKHSCHGRGPFSSHAPYSIQRWATSIY